MKQVFYFLGIILLASGCTRGSKTGTNDVVTLTLTEEAFVEQAKTSRFFTSAKCIPLATGDESIIGTVNKIVRHERYIYVSDGSALFRFTDDGTFSGKIDKRGNGPDEYIAISDFLIETTGEVWILSPGRMLNQYTWDGTLNRKILLNFPASRMHLISLGKMCLYVGNKPDENNRHQIKVIDLNTEDVLNSMLDIDEQKARYLNILPSDHFGVKEDGRCYFYDLFDDYIYSVSEDRMTKHFHINILGKNIPVSFYDAEYQDVSYFFRALSSHNYAYGTVFFSESRTMYLYSYYYKKQCHVALISKETNESVVNFTALTEDMVLYGFPLAMEGQDIQIQKDSEIIIPLQPYKIIEYGEAHPEISDRLKDAIRYTDEDQNVVLLSMKINEH
ncbi:MAG: 6-bladed beta-propeller [Tannerella sp.]|jgi:hypothetical protein|nr:6-bladed beta-propeller [Tannerella sp.]